MLKQNRELQNRGREIRSRVSGRGPGRNGLALRGRGGEPFKIALSENSSFSIKSRSFYVHSEAIRVQIAEENHLALRFLNSYKKKFTIGGIKGRIAGDVSCSSGIQTKREIFLSDDKKYAALRIRVKNKRDSRIHLQTIVPLEITDPKSLLLAGAGVSKWKVLRYPFAKSDIPSYLKPSVADKDFEDASFSCANAVPGQGVIYNTVNIASRTIASGPLMILRNFEKKNTPALMFFTLAINQHTIEMLITTTEDRQTLKRFTITCGFDEVALDPSEETGTHWLFITADGDEDDLIKTYTEIVATEFKVKAPRKPSPTVYCTWYFYTFEFKQQYLDDELNAIQEKKIPIDVFQIDDGWMDNYGSWEPNPEKFPAGMEGAAGKIIKAGMIPGIWVAPFVIDVHSPVLKKYPRLIQYDKDQKPLIFNTSTNDCYLLDPTAPDAQAFLEETFSKFKKWGYRYFKLDWLRCVYAFSSVRYANPKVNRPMAYNLAMGMIRKILGKECYLTGCGGLSDPANLNIINGMRTCKDVRGTWNGPEGIAKSGALIQIKQNLLRNYFNRFYDSDPDATQIRRRDTPFSPQERKCVGVFQSEGHYTDDEALTICTHQYLAGGLVTISERFPELQAHRLAMLRHISPAGLPRARIADYGTPVCPTLFVTEIKPKCPSLAKWWTLAVGNWEDQPIKRTLQLANIRAFLDPTAEQYAVFEFHTQSFLGVKKMNDKFEIEIPTHGIRLLRLLPWQGNRPVILGTDLHLSGGGIEITRCKISRSKIEGGISTKWRYPVVVTAGFPDKKNKIIVKSYTVQPGESKFLIQ